MPIGYRISDYGRMIADSVRMHAYAQALRQAITPSSSVLDIGAGTGIFSLLACQFGARQVYAVEVADAILTAREIALANGYADRITFIQGLSTEITLPERVDVIVSDLRGALPFYQGHPGAIIDARLRHLAPHGVLIPQVDTLWAAIVAAPALHEQHFRPWDERPFGLDMQPARTIVANTWSRCQIGPEQLLTEPHCWATLDYRAVESPNVFAQMQWALDRPGLGHGLVVWFDAILAEGVSFSNAPGQPELIYGKTFLPWPEPVALAVGDRVQVALSATALGSDYIWTWRARIADHAAPGLVKRNFEQSSFFGRSLSFDL